VILNSVEKVLMNNPLRAAVQRRFEGPLLERFGGRVDGGRVLEIGCGRGVGTEIILSRFGAAHVDAFDLDPDMVERARRRLAGFGERVRLYVGDATAIPAEPSAYDAVFDFGIVHHVPAWREAVREVVRVLRPGGRFFFEEVTRQALARWGYRTFLRHPTQDRFSGAEFVAELERAGLRVPRWTERFFGDFVFGVGFRGNGISAAARA
jgi:ubiquinone/menaquinone biosynthesis C-methylase UbiE